MGDEALRKAAGRNQVGTLARWDVEMKWEPKAVATEAGDAKKEAVANKHAVAGKKLHTKKEAVGEAEARK